MHLNMQFMKEISKTTTQYSTNKTHCYGLMVIHVLIFRHLLRQLINLLANQLKLLHLNISLQKNIDITVLFPQSVQNKYAILPVLGKISDALWHH